MGRQSELSQIVIWEITVCSNRNRITLDVSSNNIALVTTVLKYKISLILIIILFLWP